MNLSDPADAGKLAAVVAAAVAVVVFAPLVLVTGTGATIGAYYAAGPFGLTAVGLLAVVAAVVFLSVGQPHTDALTLSGVGAVVALGVVLTAVAWVLTLDSTVLFGFPVEYAWIENHRWAVLGGAIVLTAVSGLQARTVL
ncbi:MULTISPECIES: DUF7548 family protein [Halolamina]|uniref:Uncharacterized protein n=1 Tax=Halolamina pelagica TaxID=699431 RepID=A0A1I5P126_9EURY|nr:MULTISPECIES: hypothetical protein [Halolamina]NHX36570.1 hypothetical protein [Halolamina sp. R1-12]SFP27560.1 hypothetical protein SAMN05216277_102288 [Halolamina pelagica]